MAANKRTTFQREQDYIEIARRYAKAEPQAAIAKDLGVTQQQISEDIKAILGRWRKVYLGAVNDKIASELAKINDLERTHWQACEDSKTVKEVTNTGKTTGKDGDRLKAELRKEDRDGNPAFLAGVMACIDRRIKLLGLDAPEKHEHAGKDGGEIVVRTITAIIPAELGQEDGAK